MRNNQLPPFYYFLFGVICVIWGTTWFVVKVGIRSGVPSFRGAGIRFLLVSVIFLFIILFRKTPFPRSLRELRAPVFLGIFYFFVPYACLYWSQNHIPSALAAIIYGSLPIMVMAFSHFMLEAEKMTMLKVISAMIGIAGVIVIAISKNPEAGSMHFWGVMAMVVASVSTAYCTAYTKKHVNNQDIFVFLGIQILIGGVLLMLLSLVFERPFTLRMEPDGIISILYLALVGTVICWTLWIFLISRISPVFVSYVSFFIPLVALVVGIGLGNERFSSLVILGSVLIFVSIILVIQSIKREYLAKQAPS